MLKPYLGLTCIDCLFTVMLTEKLFTYFKTQALKSIQIRCLYNSAPCHFTIKLSWPWISRNFNNISISVNPWLRTLNIVLCIVLLLWTAGTTCNIFELGSAPIFLLAHVEHITNTQIGMRGKALIVIVAWLTWGSRNGRIFQNYPSLPAQLVRKAFYFPLPNYQWHSMVAPSRYWDCNPSHNINHNNALVSWLPPL